MGEIKQFQHQSQSQKQIQRMSQRQIQAVNFLAMPSNDLREEILKMADDNPALEIVSDPFSNERSGSPKSTVSVDYDKLLEQTADSDETLQKHLIDQLNLIPGLSKDEYDLSQKLIYNLDGEGFYGSMLKPETLLDSKRSLQNAAMLKKCISRIQKMDPTGTCCKDVFESLKVQAEVNGDASQLTLFILDGHLDLMNAPSTERILKNLKDFQKSWHSKAFASEIYLDKANVTEEMVMSTLKYIRTLNPHPASNYISDNSSYHFELPDVVISVEKKSGVIGGDDFSTGKIYAGKNQYFQVKYASGVLPEVRLNQTGIQDKAIIEQAKNFLGNLEYRENSIILQGCSIVKNQLDFFLEGPGHLVPLTRKQVAEQINVHESTVSRLSSKRNSKYIETSWGTFPASYFFSSGVPSETGTKVSAEAVKSRMREIINGTSGVKLSDSKLTELLNSSGIKIARRTVAKYREQLGIENSYARK